MGKHSALVIDDEPDIRELLSITLGRMDIDCTAAATVTQGKSILAEQSFDLCLTDMRLPDGDGLEIVAHIQKEHSDLPVAVITAHGNMELAIQALKAGAFDFVNKPLDINDLRNLVSQAVKLSTPDASSSSALVGESEAIKQLNTTIKKLARSQAPVYISGESGTGKELVAKLIHELGPRAEQPFIPVNCGAIPHDLIESELFGHKKGSFTGAVADKPGLFQAANQGTLFLDEVAELPLQMQVKLLRAIQEKKIRPVGEQQEVAINCRILSATHKNLAQLVEHGAFRQDLFYRINVIELAVPALRDRGGDIALLTKYFLRKLSADIAIEEPILNETAEAALLAYSFPGNVRQLENILERAVTLCEDGVINEEDLRLPAEPSSSISKPEQATAPAAAASGDDGHLQNYLDDIERQRILEALEKTRWNKTQAAKLLGISFRALRYRLEKLDLDKP
ncbi:MAG: sigma-54-dependent transcriptional regulator [Gammaproteobacteria bacterium]